MSVGGDRREVAVGTQMFGDEFANDFLIIDDENVQRIADVIEGDRFDKLRSFGNGEINFESGPHAFFAEDPDLSSVAVNDSIDHRQPESRAFFAFGGEERFEALDALAFGHADTGICDCEADAFEGGGGADDDFAPGGEGIDRIEDEIRQDLADFRGVGGYEADVVEGGFDLDLHAIGKAFGLPLWGGQGHGLEGDFFEVDGHANLIIFGGPIEFAESTDYLGGILSGGDDVI